MKKLLSLLLFITVINLSSQIPAYYNDVNLNLNGNSLKNELATKITSTHQNFLSYTPGVWDALRQTDLDLNNSNNVTLIYGYSDTDGNYVTDKTRSKNANGGSAGTQWNREHVYPKSLGTPNLGTSGAGADAHSLRAADITFNSQRGSKKFADGSGNAGDSSGGWYPGNEWKGDVARMMMYMYLRYGNQCLPKNVGIGSSVASDTNMLQLFLEWNVEDPVSDFEKQRNPALESIQGNRNPFIDNPAFATKIWGGPQAEDLFGNSNGGGNGSGGNSSELFISEYIEGSSNNKAIEIANLSGSSINLSAYSLRKTTNGNNSFGSTYNLSGQLANGKVFVIANSNASTTIKNKANTTTSSAIVTFNGNDAVALFKNNTLIDVVGNPSSSSNVIQNITLQRKSSTTSPNTSYTASEWNRLSFNNSDDLGNITGGGSTPPPVSYCASKGNNANFEYIDRVAIGGISNNTGNNNGYGNFTNLTGNLSFGNNSITVSAGFSSSSYREFWKVWIDFNKNGTFEASEQVVSSSSSSAGNLSYNFNIPSSALSGSTRMRISMKYNAAQTSCETFAYGEVEDYTVNIGTASRTKTQSGKSKLNQTGFLDKNQFNTFKVYPNPLRGNTLRIQLNDENKIHNLKYTITSIIGKELYKGTLHNNLIKITSLKAGIYLLEINNGGNRIVQKFIKK